MRKAKTVSGIVANSRGEMHRDNITVRIIKDERGASMAVWNRDISLMVGLEELSDMLKVVEGGERDEADRC